MKEYLKQELVRGRIGLSISFTLLATCASYICALALRFDFTPEEIYSSHRLGIPLALLLFFRFGTYIHWGLNKAYWRYTSAKDFEHIFKAHVASSLIFATSILLLRVPEFPRSVILIEFAFSLLLSGGSRFLARLYCERRLESAAPLGSLSAREVIVLGAGDSGHLLVKNLLSQRRLSYKPVAVLDDSDRMQGCNVYGILVRGRLADLTSCLHEQQRVAGVILAIPSLSPSRVHDLEQVCKEFGVPLKRLQSFEDIACIDATQAPDALTIEGVLHCETRIEHEEEIRRAIAGKRVLVTGAGGSIGSELVRQILPFGPERVIMLDNGEFNLFKITSEIARDRVSVECRPVLASICDERRLLQIFDTERPELVFHAAAYKHVPLLEENSYEAFVNNVLGTRNLLRCCAAADVKRFVMISTDKAVDPSSIMGCSKRIAELTVQSYRRELAAAEHKGLHTAVVRFGNVINSNGSVVPLFRQQILSGGPLTVTHPDMERYFMSIREAVRLVLTAGTLGDQGEIYILDMGKPIRIVDVARKMLALYGRRDIPIVFTGIRPGEKLSEDLTGLWEVKTPTRFRKVRRVVDSVRLESNIREWIREIEGKLEGLDDAALGRLLHDFVSDIEARAVAATPKQAALRQATIL